MILIIGAGISGLSLGYELIRQGAEVKILESNSVASGASGIGTIYLEPRFGDTPTRKLEWRSMELWHSWIKSIDERLEFFQDGQIRVATSTTEDWFEKDWNRREQEGWQQERLTQTQLSNLEPLLSTSAIYGSYLPEVSWLYGTELCHSLSKSIIKSGGVIKTNCKIENIEEQKNNVILTTADGEKIKGEIAVLANATGVSSMQGNNLPHCESVRGVHIYIETPQPYFRHHIKHHRGHLCPHPTRHHKGRAVIGTTYEEGEKNLEVPQSVIDRVLGNTSSILPEIESYPILETRSALRCKIGDGQVHARQATENSRIFYSLGHAGSGFLRAPAISHDLAHSILSFL